MGDHLDIAGAVDLKVQIALVSASVRRLVDHTVVIANSTNHDLGGRRAHGEKAARWPDDLDPRVVTDGAPWWATT